MKKNNKILILGLGLSLAFAPINSLVSSNINIAYAEEAVEENEEKELSPEEVIKKANDFLESDAFKALSEEDKKNYKELIKDLNTDNLEERKEDILNSIKNIELSYIQKQYEDIQKQYDDLKTEVLKLKADSLSDDLIKELEDYKDSKDLYETYEDYETQIKNLNTTKSKIENYNKNLEEFKKILKDGLEKYKDFYIDLKYEKAVLDDEKSNLDNVKKAIDSLNNKVKKEEKRQAYLKTLNEIIEGGEETKKATLYKKASQNLKDKFNQSLESIKSARENLEKKEEVKNVDDLLSTYDSDLKNLDGNKFVAEHDKLIKYFEDNKDKLSGEDQEKFAKLINELPEKEDSNLESIAKLKKDIEKAIKENQKENQNKGKLKKLSRQVAVKKQPATKKSRSFVRTGVKSVGIILVVLILAGIAYFFASKKSKNNK